jgi:putative nucleotidyltransferase with HDIG domain
VASRLNISRSTKLFVAATVAAGSLALADALCRVYQAPPSSDWLVLAGLTLLSGFFTIKVPSVSATISVSETFVFTSVLLFGTPAATVTVAIEALVMSSWRHRREFHKVLFNATEPTLSIWIASSLFFVLHPHPVSASDAQTSTLLVPVVVLCGTYFLLNSWLTATALGLASHLSIVKLWREHFVWLSINYFVGASVAILIVQNAANVGIATLGIILPLLLVSYLTMKTSMGRLEDANQHIAKIDSLYLSTIESLAIAVDAKDQVTHGHIRRVQRLARAMAAALHLNDTSLVKAIEAAALLHDVGKLAVPEHILNKPGKLTTAEFENIKRHASVGAEILSSIDFPYPVVPIVRHHHENWDGSGYPDGLAGTDIPVGARILSVVDCFDALISDRPYRSRLGNAEALAILKARSGSMYDPFIVETFLRMYRDVHFDESPYLQTHVLTEIHRSTQASQNTDATSIFSEAAHLVSHTGHASIEKLCGQIARCFPRAICAIYLLNKTNSHLFPVLTAEIKIEQLDQLAIPLGQGISGWVAANQQPIFNSDSDLDVGSKTNRFAGNCCMSAPLVATSGRLVGVLTFYNQSSQPFTESECAVLEIMALTAATLLGEGAISAIPADTNA